ncbi:hypothetical protein TWF696_000033 [Orbilia brochopaga]|uniref:Uncharacterized protein n=1 Tax=Orbilia brochopaga TaxID=3140254 RepID=A0AAV9VAJ0_9PEZI
MGVRTALPTRHNLGLLGIILLLAYLGAVHEMGKKTGLRVPATPAGNASQQVAKPMPSAKDLNPDAKNAQVETAKKAAADAPKPRISSGFVPPHLRRAIKKPAEQTDEAKAQADPISETPPPAEQDTSSGNVPTPTPVRVRSPSPVKAQDDIEITRASSRPRSKDDLETLRAPAPKISGALGDSQPPSAPEWNSMFWQRVIKPLWGNILEEYDDAVKQIVFLTQHYTSNSEEWEEILKNGTPSPEKIAQITCNTFIKLEEKEEKDMKSQFEKMKLSTEKAEGGNSVPSLEPWLSCDVPDAMISDWAGKLQESHRHCLMEGLKDRVRQEKDARQTRLLYDRISLLSHGTKGGQGNPAPVKQSSRNTNDRHTETTSLLVDIAGPGTPNNQWAQGEGKKLSPLSRFMEEYGKDFVSENIVMSESTGEKVEITPPVVASAAEATASKALEDRENRFIRPSIPSASADPPATFAQGPAVSSKPKDASAERREKEKAERMAQIAREFEQRKTVAKAPTGKQGTDDFRESAMKNIQKNVTKHADLLDLSSGEALNKKGRLEGTPLKDIIAGKATVGDASGKDKKSKAIEGQSILDQQSEDKLKAILESNNLLDLSELVASQVPLSAEDLARVRAQNREMAPKLAVTDPWRLHVELEPKAPGSKPIVITLHCTDNMPLDFIKGLREILGAKQFAEVAKSEGFRKAVVKITGKFYEKMARQWGAQFAYGLAG